MKKRINKKRIGFLIMICVAVFSCNKGSSSQKSTAIGDSTAIATEKQLEQTLLEELSQKPLPENYERVGELKVETMQYNGFQMGDRAHYLFVNEQGEEVDFGDNTTDVNLIVDATNPSDENGGYEPNPDFLNKNFRVIWQTINLTKEPSDIMEMYYQEYNQIVYLKEVE